MSETHPSARVFFNIVGGGLTLLSLQLPWLTINGLYPVSVQPQGLYLVAFYWILAGAILSFLSRYGGLMTLLGIFAFAGEPYTSFGFIRVGEGVLLAVGGLILTLMGASWSIPRTILKRRELVGGILYAVGFLIILTFVLGTFVYGSLLGVVDGEAFVVEMPLLLVGLFITVLGLRLFLSRERKGESLNLLSNST